MLNPPLHLVTALGVGVLRLVVEEVLLVPSLHSVRRPRQPLAQPQHLLLVNLQEVLELQRNLLASQVTL